jgi:REP element-mobilizing transposase RayT
MHLINLEDPDTPQNYATACRLQLAPLQPETQQSQHIYRTGKLRPFLKRLRQYLKPSERVEILAYCLMPNQTHLLPGPLDDDLSRHMQKFSISYTKVMNKRYSKVGELFQGSFQAKLIERDE